MVNQNLFPPHRSWELVRKGQSQDLWNDNFNPYTAPTEKKTTINVQFWP